MSAVIGAPPTARPISAISLIEPSTSAIISVPALSALSVLLLLAAQGAKSAVLALSLLAWKSGVCTTKTRLLLLLLLALRRWETAGLSTHCTVSRGAWTTWLAESWRRAAFGIPVGFQSIFCCGRHGVLCIAAVGIEARGRSSEGVVHAAETATLLLVILRGCTPVLV